MAAPPKLRRLNSRQFNVDANMRPFVNQLMSALNPFLSDTSNAINKRLTLGENLVNEVKDVTVKAPSTYGWTDVTTFDTAGVSAFSGRDCRYRMTPGGQVELSMQMTIPSTAAAITMFTLPEGYRPQYQVEAAGTEGFGNCTAIRITTAGVVSKPSTTSTTGYFGFAGAFPVNPVGAAPIAAFTGNDWPIRLNTSLKTVTRVTLLNCTDADSNLSTVTTYQPDWSFDAQGYVIIKSIWGLVPGRRYNLKLFLEA